MDTASQEGDKQSLVKSDQHNVSWSLDFSWFFQAKKQATQDLGSTIISMVSTIKFLFWLVWANYWDFSEHQQHMPTSSGFYIPLASFHGFGWIRGLFPLGLGTHIVLVENYATMRDIQRTSKIESSTNLSRKETRWFSFGSFPSIWFTRPTSKW